MRSEDEPAGDVGRIRVDRLVRRRPEIRVAERRREPGVDGDEVGLLAGLERADPVVEPERPRPGQGAHPKPVERSEGRGSPRRASDPQGVLGVGPDPHDREDRRIRPAGDVRAEADPEAGLAGSGARGMIPEARKRFEAGNGRPARRSRRAAPARGPRGGRHGPGSSVGRGRRRGRRRRRSRAPPGRGGPPRRSRPGPRRGGSATRPRSGRPAPPSRGASRPCTRPRTAA